MVSGGDSYQLKARQITLIGNKLLEMPNIRRIRFATKGPAVMPMKLITDTEWLDALTAVVERGRTLHKEVVLHTHFNHPNEITAITKRALDGVFERGIITRNQVGAAAWRQRRDRDDAAAREAPRSTARCTRTTSTSTIS